MLRSQTVAKHLPYLRRYARAVTGNQEMGDAWVRSTLEYLIQNSEITHNHSFSRIHLYRALHTAAQSNGSANGLKYQNQINVTSINKSENNPDEISPLESAELRLKELLPDRRQALLLTALEGFSAQEAAEVMGKTPDEVGKLLEAATDDINRDIRTDVLIIEDESVIALDLSTIVRELGHRVLPVAVTRSEAVAAARRQRPGLILADIQLADDSSGIDAVKDIMGDGKVPVVFITAYPERLLTGERPEPTFLIAKPFMPGSVKAAVSQALFCHPPKST